MAMPFLCPQDDVCKSKKTSLASFPWQSSFIGMLVLAIFLVTSACASVCMAQSLEEQAACLEIKNCAGSYGERVRAMQGALITLYERTLEQGQSKEHLASLESCLEELNEVFRYHSTQIVVPGASDVVKATESILEEVCEGLCQDALHKLQQEKRDWNGIWDDVQRSLLTRAEDWTRITRRLELGNAHLMETMRVRLRQLLP